MKKIITLGSFMLLLASSIGAQSFAFFQGDTQLEDNAEITASKISIDDGDGQIPTIEGMVFLESGLRLKNISDNSISVAVSQTVITYPPMNEDGDYLAFLGFCFGTCNTGNNNKTKPTASDAPIILDANSFETGLHVLLYVYEGVYTSVKAKYEVFSPTDLSKTDKKTVFVTYNYNENSTGLNDLHQEQKITALQNGTHVNFNYAFDAKNAQLEIYSITGQKIAQHYLPSGKGSFTLPEQLSKGIYVYTVKSEKEILAVQKIIVK
jgi:hypothetical protein